MKLELLKEPIHVPRPYFYDGHNTIIHIGNYGNHPIYISKTVPRFWVGMCGREGEVFIQ